VPHFTEATTHYWQQLLSPEAAPQAASDSQAGPWRLGYPARLPDGRILMLPIRPLAAEPHHAVASLLVNQASMEVVRVLSRMLGEALAPLAPDLVMGLPTLGLSLAPGVAERLGHSRYVPLGYSRKFWYEEPLSTAVHSITSPTPGKRVYLDPHLLPLLQGKRVALVDDTLSTGTTMAATWDLMERLGVQVVGCGVAMLQGERWRQKLGPQRTQQAVGVLRSPLLRAVPEGWALRD
jgi:adenine/guanine phosphoribosyltransferase-like PRPP-binding protein